MLKSKAAIRLGTRGSLLARSQSQVIADELMRAWPGLVVELVIIQTSGDRIVDRPIRNIGGKGLFTKEIEQALLDGQIDLAVHSMKDLPVTQPLVAQENLIIGAVPAREDPADVLISTRAEAVEQLPEGARVGTTSLRRRSQLLAARMDLMIEPLRGNVDTRLRKLKEGQFDAIVLAMAGLKRTGLFDPLIMSRLSTETMVPAAAQGTPALQCRKDDEQVTEIVRALHDPTTCLCVDFERELVRRLEGDCHSPIAAFASMADENLTIRAVVGGREGQSTLIRAVAAGGRQRGEELLDMVYRELLGQGARRLLHGSE